MARPRKDGSIAEDSVESLNLKIEEQKIKIQKLIDKKEKIENAEYITLGKKVRELFSSVMPSDLNGQIEFLTNLSKRLIQSQTQTQTNQMNTQASNPNIQQ